MVENEAQGAGHRAQGAGRRAQGKGAQRHKYIKPVTRTESRSDELTGGKLVTSNQ